MIDVVAIDDDPGICWLLREIFALAGVSHLVTSSVAEVIGCVEQERPPVAIIDVSLAGADGVKVAKQVNEISPATEVIFLTGYGNGVAGKAGFPCRVIEKPFDIDHLVTVVLEHIAAAKARCCAASGSPGR